MGSNDLGDCAAVNLLVLGADGQVGRALRRCAAARGLSPTFLDRGRLDITDRAAVSQAVRAVCPGVVINAAAFTDVDGAEEDRQSAFAVNRDGPANLADASADADMFLIHVSTDFVFDGNSDRPYREDDALSPLSVYGESKAAGEEAVRERLDSHIILRTSWIFSAGRRNFVTTILRLSGEQEELHVVDDQIGGPTDAASVAGALLDLATAAGQGSRHRGIYHFSGAPSVSRYAFAEDILAMNRPFADRQPRLLPVATSVRPAPARRPARAVLDCSRIFRDCAITQPDWHPGLARVIADWRGGAA